LETTPIPVKSITIPPHNRTIGEAQLEELTATMKERGLLQPIIVAAHPTKKSTFELIAGERRLLAAKKLKWLQIDARVLTATDDEIREIRLIENLQRQDLTPWEEAEQLAAICDAGRIEDIAARVGRSPGWVATRLAFNRLIPELRTLVQEQDWPLTHLPLLARVPPESQPKIMAQIRVLQGTADDGKTRYFHPGWQDPNDDDQPIAPTRRHLEELLAEHQRDLSAAPWKLDDADLLPKAGACSACPKRSSAQYLLFPELADGKEDACLDESCWKSKQAALIQVSIDKLQAKGQQPVLLHTSYQPPQDEELKQALGPVAMEFERNYRNCKKGDPGAVPAVLVDGPQAGSTKYVSPYAAETPSNGANGAKPERPVNQETGEREGPSNDDRVHALKLKRMCRAGEIWSEKLPELKPVWKGCLDGLIVFFGTTENRSIRAIGSCDHWADFAAHKLKLAEDAWAQLCPVLQRRLQRFGTQEMGMDIWREANSQAKALAFPDVLERCWQEAVDECPQPKVLATAGVADEIEVPV
jgi:ParB/RepB/Spo0J family partition protein